MSEREILLGYAKKGEPDSIRQVMWKYAFGDDEMGFEEDKQEQQRWAAELKKLAVAGNIVAQQLIAEYSNLDRAWEDFGLGESREQIAAMQDNFRNNIFSQADAGNTEAIVSKSILLYDHQNPQDGEEENRLAMLMTAAEGGNARACEALYQYYAYGGFTLYGLNMPDPDAYAQERTDLEKAMYYLQKGANCTDYYSYKCKKELANQYFRIMLSGGSGQQAEQLQKYLESYKYWLRAAAESGSLEALEKEGRIQEDIEVLEQMHPEIRGLNHNYVSSKAAAPGQGASAQGKKGGCYVATCVYGSYDCPEVWVLRRYRDNVLADTWYGRAFIRFYYWAAPKAVKWFGGTAWFHQMFKKPIDSMVQKLKDRGFADTPYQD